MTQKGGQSGKATVALKMEQGPRATDDKQPQNLPGEGEGSDSRRQPEPYFDLTPLKKGAALLNSRTIRRPTCIC